MSIAQRAIAACALTMAALCAAPAAGALASTSASHPAISHVRADAATHRAIGRKAPGLIPAGKPSGCPTGDMCIYSKGNGGDLCIATPGNEPNLGACAWVDQSVFNNGFVGNPNGVVAMNVGLNYTYAWTCIGTGKYWLYTSEYTFNGGPGLPGYGDSVADAVGSFHWQSNNCGNAGP